MSEQLTIQIKGQDLASPALRQVGATAKAELGNVGAAAKASGQAVTTSASQAGAGLTKVKGAATDAAAGMDKLGSAADKSGSQTQGAFARMTTAAQQHEAALRNVSLGMIAVGGSITAMAALGVKAQAEQEASSTKLAAAIKGSGQAIDQAKLERLAGELQKTTQFSDDATLEMMAMLASFQLTGSEIEQLAPRIQNIAALMGTDLHSAAIAVGKAIQTGSWAALRRYGIVVDEAVAKSGDFAAIMKEIDKNTGPAAEMLGNTATGAAARLTNQFGELQESIGKALIPSLITLAKAATPIVEGLAKIADSPVGRTLVTVTAAGGGLLTVLGGIGLALPPVVKGWGYLTAAYGRATGAARLAGTAQTSAGTAAAGAGVEALAAAKAWDALALAQTRAGGANLVGAGVQIAEAAAPGMVRTASGLLVPAGSAAASAGKTAAVEAAETIGGTALGGAAVKRGLLARAGAALGRGGALRVGARAVGGRALALAGGPIGVAVIGGTIAYEGLKSKWAGEKAAAEAEAQKIEESGAPDSGANRRMAMRKQMLAQGVGRITDMSPEYRRAYEGLSAKQQQIANMGGQASYDQSTEEYLGKAPVALTQEQIDSEWQQIAAAQESFRSGDLAPDWAKMDETQRRSWRLLPEQERAKIKADQPALRLKRLGDQIAAAGVTGSMLDENPGMDLSAYTEIPNLIQTSEDARDRYYAKASTPAAIPVPYAGATPYASEDVPLATDGRAALLPSRYHPRTGDFPSMPRRPTSMSGPGEGEIAGFRIESNGPGKGYRLVLDIVPDYATAQLPVGQLDDAQSAYLEDAAYAGAM